MSHQTITREELYDEVWSKPMMRLARSFGLSDVGLAKLCKRHNIPRPPRGYWAKVEAGQKPRRIPLPPQDGSEEIRLYPPKEDSLEQSGLADQVEQRVANEKQQESKIVVSDNLRGAHSLVTATRDELYQAKPNGSGILVYSGKLSLDVSVSKDQMRRTLLIFDALLKGLEARGYRVVAGPRVTIFGEQVGFGIKEAVSVEKEQPREHDLSGRYEFGFNRFVSRNVPNGKLALFIHDADRYWASGCRKQWRDGSKQRLEDVLNRVVAGLIEVAARKQDHEIEMEQRRIAEEEAAKRRQEAAQRRAELKAKQDKERARLNELLGQAEGFRKSQEIRQLVEAVRKAQAVDGDRLEAWTSWALMHADRFDPTKESPPCILDEELPEEPRRW